MIKLSDIKKNSAKEIILSSGITVTIRNILTVSEQMDLGLAEIATWKQEDMAKNLPMIAFKLITNRDVCDDENKILDVTYENFSTMPISFDDMNAIIGSCESIQPKENLEKKNIGEIL